MQAGVHRRPRDPQEPVKPRDWLILAAVLVALAVICAVVWLGWPASGWATFFVCAHLLSKGIEKEVSPARDSRPQRGTRIAKGTLTAAGNYCLWAAVGCALVWVAQLLLALFASDPDPATIGRAELLLADVANAIREHTTPAYVVILFSFVIAVSVAFERFWPISALGRVRRISGNVAAVLGAIGGFSFVGAGVAGARYDKASQILRAEVVKNLSDLARVRREGAAFTWLSSLAAKASASGKPQRAAWRSFFDGPLAACARDEATFSAGYSGSALRSTASRTVFCDARALHDLLAGSRLKLARTGGEEASANVWLSDLRPLVTAAPAATAAMLTDPDTQAGLAPSITRIADLRQVARMVKSKLEDASAARDAVRRAAAGSVGTLLQGMAPEAAGELFKFWSGALLDDAGKVAMGRIGQRVRLTRLADNRVVAALFAIDEADSAILPPPADGELAAAEGMSEYRSYLIDNGR